jgi:hypothetical protein
MKTMVLILLLASSVAQANIGGPGRGALSGYYECGPEEGVSVTIDMQERTGKIKGKKSNVDLVVVSGGARNGNASYELEGALKGETVTVTFKSIMGRKKISFTHPSGKEYDMNCETSESPDSEQEGF